MVRSMLMGSILGLCLAANVLVWGCNGKKPTDPTQEIKPPVIVAPADPTDVLSDPKATVEQLKEALKNSKKEGAELKQRIQDEKAASIVAKLWWAFGICCLSVAACVAAFIWLPIFKAQAVKAGLGGLVGAALCLVGIKLVPYMWWIAWILVGLIVVVAGIYFLRHVKGMSTAYAWLTEFSEKASEVKEVAKQKEEFFVNKLSTSGYNREYFKQLKDKVLASVKKVASVKA